MLPVVPREESELLLMLEEAEVGFESFPGWSVDLALGDGYASTVRFELDDGYLVREGGTYLTDLDGLTLTSATVQSGELGARLVDGKSLELTAREVGDFNVRLEGDWVPAADDEPSARSFSIELGVRVRRVGSVVWNACVHSPVRVIAGTPFAMAWHELFDENGERFSPANARSSSNVEFTVRAAPGTKLTAKDGLSSLVAEGPDQRIQVEAFGSSVGSFELIQLDEVDGLEARFMFAADWMRGTTELFDGDTAYVPGAEREPGHIGVAPMLSVGGVKVCSPPLPEWFEVRSETPATCSETSELGCGGACPESALPVVVLAENVGTCELAVIAPATNGGGGTRAARSVELIPLGGDDTGR